MTLNPVVWQTRLDYLAMKSPTIDIELLDLALNLALNPDLQTGG